MHDPVNARTNANAARALANLLFGPAGEPCALKGESRCLEPAPGRKRVPFQDHNPASLCDACAAYWFAERAAQTLERSAVFAGVVSDKTEAPQPDDEACHWGSTDDPADSFQIRIAVFRDGGQWFARIRHPDGIAWEGWLCEESDTPDTVATVALVLMARDSDTLPALAARGVTFDDDAEGDDPPPDNVVAMLHAIRETLLNPMAGRDAALRMIDAYLTPARLLPIDAAERAR
jgi:hypothetical protein